MADLDKAQRKEPYEIFDRLYLKCHWFVTTAKNAPKEGTVFRILKLEHTASLWRIYTLIGLL